MIYIILQTRFLLIYKRLLEGGQNNDGIASHIGLYEFAKENLNIQSNDFKKESKKL